MSTITSTMNMSGWETIPTRKCRKTTSITQEPEKKTYCKTKPIINSRLCKSKIEGGKCPHGDTCRFAHRLEDLVLSPCSERACSLVCSTKQGGFTNSGSFKCFKQHEGETRTNYFKRIGLSKFATPTRKVTPPAPRLRAFQITPPALVLRHAIPIVEEEKEEKEEIDDVMDRVREQAKKIGNRLLSPPPSPPSHSPPSPPPQQKDETVLRVPKELAMMAMEMAMKTGKTNIRIELV